jgi:predicted transcriptional regulator
MRAVWQVNGWVTVQSVRDRMDYHRPVAYTTVATVIGNLCDKGMLYREIGDGTGHPGSGVWWYHATRPEIEHTAEVIAALLDHSPNPTAVLAHALATAQTVGQIKATLYFADPIGDLGPSRRISACAATAEGGGGPSE